MIIGLDLDDILLNFSDTLRLYYNDLYKTDLKREDMISFHLENVFNLSVEETIKRVSSFYLHDTHFNAPPVPGSVEGVTKLNQHHTLHVITAKPELIRDRTEKWLHKHFPNMFAGVHFANHFISDDKKKKKSEICRELGVELFVEDALHNADDVADSGIPVLLLDTPWNQAETHPLVTRVFSWDEILQKINN